MNQAGSGVRRVLLVAVLMGASLAICVWLYGLGFLSIPSLVVQEREVIGGNWELVYVTSTLGHPSTTMRLIRRRGPLFSTIASSLSSFQYLGENCVSYQVSDEGGRSLWAACDFRAPVELYRGFGLAEFGTEVLQVQELRDGTIAPVKTLTFQEIRALAVGPR